MISKVLKVGDRVEMKRWVTANTPNEKPKVYASQLIEVTDDNKLNILIPIEGSKIIPFEVGGRFELRFITSSGIYICKAEIANRCKQGNIYFFQMLLLSELRKDQRRQYFRLEKVRSLSYHKLTASEKALLEALSQNKYKDEYEKKAFQKQLKEAKGEEHEGTLLNISGGGMKFNSGDERLEVGEEIRISILLDDYDADALDLFARVMSSEKGANVNSNYEYRTEFMFINRDTREKIVKYVFNEDRKQRQKEKGNY